MSTPSALSLAAIVAVAAAAGEREPPGDGASKYSAPPANYQWRLNYSSSGCCAQETWCFGSIVTFPSRSVPFGVTLRISRGTPTHHFGSHHYDRVLLATYGLG
jgi:hypothetical protein